jgi:DNA-binding GntR family transcriptional regulator
MMSPAGVEHLSTRSLAYQDLKFRIIRGEIGPGAKLSERTLSVGLGASRTPLREALLQLESERLVERTEAGSWRIPRLDERSVRDIFAVRKQLEVLAVRLCIERGSDTEVAQLESHLEAAEVAHANLDLLSMNDANGQFHTAVYRCAHSPWLETAMEPVRNQTIRIRFLIAGHVAQPEYEEGHRRIFDSLTSRSLRTAEAIMSDHVDENLHVAIRHLDVLAGPTKAPRYPGGRDGGSSGDDSTFSLPPRRADATA